MPNSATSWATKLGEGLPGRCANRNCIGDIHPRRPEPVAIAGFHFIETLGSAQCRSDTIATFEQLLARRIGDLQLGVYAAPGAGKWHGMRRHARYG